VAKDALDIIAAPAAKGDEPGITATASALGVALVLVPTSELETAGERAVTRSQRVVALMGVPSVAEAAALAAAGGTARLLVPRIAIGSATCALATTGGAP
jgi:cobalt-precorrin 5A hydrolase